MSDKGLSGLILKFSKIIIILLFTLITIYPLAQTILISIKPVEEFTVNPLGIPKALRMLNYIDAWVQGDMSLLFLNTIIVTGATIILVIFLASPVGFVLSKLRIRGEKYFYNYFLIGLVIPFQAIMIPLMKVTNVMGMTNKLVTLIIVFVGTNLSFPILVYTGFYKSIPFEIIEAARIDGCNILKIFTDIIFPLTTAINLTIAIFVGKVPWSDFFVPLLFTSDKSSRTLPFGLFSFQSQYFNDWTLTFAMIVMMSLPLVLLFIFAQKYFMNGITAGSVKG
jgi:ABC-type sugar transport system, permease component